MMLFRFPKGNPPPETLRELAEEEDFRETPIYFGGVCGWSDAPSLPDEAAQNARDAVLNRIEDKLGQKAEALEPEEEEQILERYGWDD